MPADPNYGDDAAPGWIGYTVRFVVGAVIGALLYLAAMIWLVPFHVWVFVGVVVAFGLLSMLLGDRLWDIVRELAWWV